MRVITEIEKETRTRVKEEESVIERKRRDFDQVKRGKEGEDRITGRGNEEGRNEKGTFFWFALQQNQIWAENLLARAEMTESRKQLGGVRGKHHTLVPPHRGH